MSSTVPYRITDRPLTSPVTTFLWEPREGGEVEASGECPECRCVTRRVWKEVQYVTKGPGSSRGPGGEDTAPRYARCACETWHVDRPAGVEKGCGASFWVAPPRGNRP